MKYVFECFYVPVYSIEVNLLYNHCNGHLDTLLSPSIQVNHVLGLFFMSDEHDRGQTRPLYGQRPFYLTQNQSYMHNFSANFFSMTKYPSIIQHLQYVQKFGDF